MPTWNSRGLRGSTLEDLLNRTNEKYLENGLALIQKIPTPITPINIGIPVYLPVNTLSIFSLVLLCLL